MIRSGGAALLRALRQGTSVASVEGVAAQVRFPAPATLLRGSNRSGRLTCPIARV